MFGLRKKKQNPREELRAVLGDIELPTFPAIVTVVLERIRDEDVSFNEISDLLASDPGLTVKLLRTVNSAAFALRQNVNSVHHAVSLLGRNQLESILISIAVGQSVPASAARGFIVPRFWATSARRAVAGRLFAELIDPSTASESFSASLLQDLAVPFLSQHKGESYADVLEAWHAGEGDLATLERQAFDWDHAEVAGWICAEWDLPERITTAIAAHHGTDLPSPALLPAVGLVAPMREVDEQPGIERVLELAEQHCRIPRDAGESVLERSAADAEELARMFG